MLKDFGEILNMRLEMEKAYAKSLKKVHQFCEEKVEKYQNPEQQSYLLFFKFIYFRESSKLIHTLIRSYGDSLKQRHIHLSEFVDSLQKIVKIMINGCETISAYSNEKVNIKLIILIDKRRYIIYI